MIVSDIKELRPLKVAQSTVNRVCDLMAKMLSRVLVFVVALSLIQSSLAQELGACKPLVSHTNLNLTAVIIEVLGICK